MKLFAWLELVKQRLLPISHFMEKWQTRFLLLLVYLFGIGLTAMVGKMTYKAFLQNRFTKSSWLALGERPGSSVRTMF